MATFPRARKKRLVLDIGTSAIRLCELTQTKSGYQLTRYLQREYNSDPALDDTAKKDLRVKALRELLKDAKVRTKKTIFGVPGQSVFTRTRALPPVPEYKVTQIVRYEIQQQIPFSLDQIAMDYQVLDRTAAGGYEVLMAAIKVDVVDKHLEVLDACKRTVDVVDVSPLAAYNWLKHTQEFGDQGECVALIDLGASTTDIIIEREGQFRFTRPLNVGGNDITKALAGKFGMNFSDAERAKRDRCAAPTGDPNRDGPQGQVVGDVLQRMVGEIQRSFAYFRSLPGGGQVNRVILCGGGACLRNIIPYLQRALGLEVRIAQPLAGLAIAPGAQQVNERPEQACIALGLALRCCEPATIEISLVPPRVLEAARRREQIFYWTLSLATLALIMASVIPVSANENQLVIKRTETYKQVLSMYDRDLGVQVRQGNTQALPKSAKEDELDKEVNKVLYLQRRVDLLDNSRKNRRFWLDEFGFLNDARPSTGGVWLYALETTLIGTPDGKKAGAGGGGRKAAAPKERGSGLREFAGNAGGGPTGPDRIGTPFPGLVSPDVQPGLSGGGGLGKGNERRPGGPGGKKGGAKSDSEFSSTPIDRPNAIYVNGVAESATVVKAYVEALKKGERILTDGRFLTAKAVHYKEGSVQQVDPSIIYQLPVGGFRGQQPSGPAWNTTNPFYLFTVEVEFQVTDERPIPGAAAAAAEAAAAGPGGPGGPGQQPPNMPNNAPGPGPQGAAPAPQAPGAPQGNALQRPTVEGLEQ